MRNLKKITAIVLVVAMMLSLVSMVSFAAGEPVTLKVVADKTNVKNGEVVTLSVYVEGTTNAIGMATWGIPYDTTAFEYVDGSVTTALGRNTGSVNEGKMKMMSLNGSEDVSDTVAVQTAQFKANKDVDVTEAFNFNFTGYQIKDLDNADYTVTLAPATVNIVPDPLRNIQKANLVDRNGVVTPVNDASYSISKVQDEESGVIKVTVNATELAEHSNGTATDGTEKGYWIGFSVVAPAGATKMKYGFGDSANPALGGLTGLDQEVVEGKDGIAFYVDASKVTKKYMSLQWYKEDGTPAEGDVIWNYELDLSNVTFNWIKKGDVKAANVAAENYTTNSVAATGDADTIAVAVTTEELKEHKNGEDTPGYWTGFSVVAPDGATQMKYGFDTTEKPALGELTGLDQEVVEGKPGIAFYADANAANPKKYASLQWFDGAGNALSAVTYFEMDLTNVTFNWIKKDTVKAANIVDADGKEVFTTNSVVATGDAGTITVAVTTEGLKKHKNGAGTDGFWTGFSVVAPDGATQMKYGFSTTEKPALGELTELDQEVVEGKPGIAFFTDATAPKTYASLQWYDADGNALSAVTYFVMDLSGVDMLGNASNGGVAGLPTTGNGGGTVKPVDPEDPAVDPEDPAVDPEVPGTDVPGTPVAGLFEDVPADHWAADYIKQMKDMGVVSGKSATTFEPDATITRAEFVKMIAVAFGLEIGASESAFEDCGADDWYTPYVVAAAEAGYVNGISDTAFGANDAISRQDICTIIGRILGLTAEEAEVAFADIDDIADYALEAVKALANMGILKGYEDGTFAPTKNATRAEVCKILSSILAAITEEVPEEDAAEEEAVVEDAVEEEAAEEEAVVEEDATEEETAEEVVEEEVADEE